MQKIILYIVILFYCNCQIATAQSYKNPNQKKLDSLRTILSDSEQDMNRVNTLNMLAQRFIESIIFDGADSAAQEALKLAEKLHYTKGQALAYSTIGRIYLSQNMSEKARDYFFKAVVQSKLISDHGSESKHYSNVGITYYKEGNSLLAMHYFFKALHIAEEYKDPQAIAASCNGIGIGLLTQSNFNAALEYFTRAVDINTDPEGKDILCTSLNCIAYTHEKKGDSYKAFTWYMKTLEVAEELGDLIKIEKASSGIATSYYRRGDYPEALIYYYKCLKILESGYNKSESANMLTGVATCYLNTGDQKRAMEFFFKAHNMAKASGDKKMAANLLGNVGIAYEMRKDTLMAISYYLKAIESCKQQGIYTGVSLWYCNLAQIHAGLATHQKDASSRQAYLTKASDFYDMGLKQAEAIQSKTEITFACIMVSRFYIDTEKLELAETYLQRALKLSFETGELDTRKEIYNLLSQLNAKQKQYKAQVENYMKYITLRDSILNTENSTKALRSEFNFEYERKQSLEQAKQEQKDLLTAADRKRQQVILFFVIAVAFLILIGSVFMYRSYIQKQRINNELSVKNERIEIAHKIIKEKNHEITDSINYALHIQQAMLPDKQEIYNALPQSFVLFKPKDIVSGDFYFFSIYHDKIFIAAADCTGHGVPGGFMSMIGSEKLNNAIKQHDDPGKILSLLNKGIKASLHQSESAKANRDGMDVALCAIDLNNSTVDFSGANRPLWIIRKDSALLEEIKGTKVSIGGLTEDDKTFETHRLQLQKGDTFYLCSDGYADQFGANDKKLTTKRLKNILTEISSKPISEQDHYLDQFITEWRGNTEQTDDVLLVGVRL